MNPSIPASRFGEFACDTPADLGISAFTSMSSLINMSSVAFAIFTGDLVSHDGVTRISREYVEYEEKIQYETFKANLGDIVSDYFPTYTISKVTRYCYPTAGLSNPRESRFVPASVQHA